MSTKKRLTKTRRVRQERETDYLLNNRFAIKRIEPMTRNQENLFRSYINEKNILAIGSAGTGKTYISLYLALKDVLQKNHYKEVIIVRSSVQSREQGHMPGNASEKMANFEQPYVDIVNDLMERGDGYQILKQKGMIRFMSTSFIRGLTFNDAIIIVDEVQNLTYGEIRTILTRVGTNSRIILCGDTKQDDLKYSKNRSDVSGLVQVSRVIDNMKGDSFDKVVFTIDDIVRSDFVKHFIIAEETLEAA
jgi:phosphate starvation-inducible protein PhoH and related proteins